MSSKSSKSDLASRRAQFMAEDAGTDRFAVASKITQERPSGTAPRMPAPVEEGSPQPGGTVTVPLDQVLDNPLNARQTYREQRVKDLAANIGLHGQLAPAIACRTSDVLALLDGPETQGLKRALKDAPNAGAPYLLIGGHYRKMALRVVNRPIELKVATVRSLMELYALSYAENDQREDPSPLDDALSWQNLLQLGVAKTQEDIAGVTGKSRAVIAKTLSLLKLPPEILELFRDAQTAYSHPYALTQLMGHIPPDRLFEYAQKIVSGAISTRELDEVVKTVTAGAKGQGRKKKELSRQHKIHHGGQEIGVLKDWDNGRLLLDVTLPIGSARDELLTELRSHFEALGGQLGLP